MATNAYCQYYLAKCSRTVGFMLHDAVLVFGLDGSEFLRQFISCGIAEQIENGNPKYIAGKSGLELFFDVTGKNGDECTSIGPIENYEKSDVYWVGWMLAHYQWYSGKSFEEILDKVPFEELLCLYKTLHEADIQKSYEVMDAHFSQ